MNSISPQVIGTVLASIAFQLAGLALLPRTKGFSEPLFTIGCAASFLLGIWLMARLLESGINLSSLIPFMAAVVPLGVVLIGLLVYGEPSSALKTAMLIAACALVGLASRFA